jgi:hypothetical protein
MATVEELTAQLDALRTTRAQGAQIVRTADGRSVTYRSDAELVAAIVDIERQISAATGDVPVTTILVSASKGLT